MAKEAGTPAPGDGRAGRRAAAGRPPGGVRQLPLEHSILLTATLCLLAAGAVMVYSASSPRSLLAGQGPATGYLIKFVAYGAVGLVGMRLLARHGLESVRRATPALLLVSFGLLLAIKLPGVGRDINGARRWIGAGPVQFEPSELMKLALVLYAAHVLSSGPTTERRLRKMLRPLLLTTGAACGLVVLQPDLGTAIILAFVVVAVMVAAGVPVRTLGKLAVAGVVLAGLFAVLEPYRRARLTAFLDPWAHAGTTGFQAVQGQIAIGSGGLLGVGPGQSVQKVFYLPEAHTDFILAVIGEELGVMGVCVLLFLYGLIAYAGLRAAKAASGTYAALLAVGITSLIVGQATLNVFAVLGIAPLTGVPLPLVSYGSTNLIVLLAGVGLLLNVAGGGAAHLRALGTPDAKPRRSGGGRDQDRDRGGGDGGARRAGSGRGRRAAGARR
ncbi:MAG: cell division protein FtsW [Solirubrobacteraceae bacterium]|jgi:cell division protein FtsW|nr:cell division protein FtsW [Solirubrobacteraceae bacterium]